MKALKIPFFASAEDILRMARKRYGKQKRFVFVEWPDGHPFGSVRLVVMSNEEWEDFNGS